MPGPHDERSFEDAIEASLLHHGGWAKGTAYLYDRARGLDTGELFAFIGATQAKAWQRLLELHGGDPDFAQRKFADRLAQQLDSRGTVDVLRHGVEDLGVPIRLAHFRSASGLNPDLEQLYAANRLTVVRQLHYSVANPDVSIDLALFVNGLPVATAELKNPLTRQTVKHAVAQYRRDRDPADVLLGRRAVVHFAVDPDTVLTTTRLAGRATRFLPFNQGTGGPGNPGGAGNPAGPPGRHATAYLWEQVWARDAWLDLLARFVHVEQSAPGKKAKATRQQGNLIFPRYHQWDAVRRLEAHARSNGAGQHYLVQHSAGSGKSNTIAWLAHRLSSLHDAADTKVFDKVVVITDRRVLDRQLQDTIYQFEHAHGLVAKIDQDSGQLASALAGAEAKIVITTLQKFPFVVDRLAALPGRRYAVLVDEAHSSQTGEAAKEMKAALGGELVPGTDEDTEVDSQDLLTAAVEASARARGRQHNLSLFAFTATPKGKTLELFGDPVTDGGERRFRPFHLYSMRQAIEEGFILDVLANYTTYGTYFRLQNAGTDDREVESRKAAAAIAAYVSLHPDNLSQRARIIVEHFRAHTAREIAGQAKAMVVCRSRLHAVRMRLAIESHLREHGIGGVNALVAFSGTVTDPDTGAEHTEPRMNGFPESETAARFATPAYQLLVVAEKFQTGFDQPLLHTMFVDKKLAGVHAVQTLSRLNRIHPDKATTFVLDFANDADAIQRDFEPYYDTTLATPTDPNALFDARNALEAYGVLRAEEIDAFAAVWFAGDPGDRGLHARLYATLDPARERFVELDEDDQEEFRTALDRFVHLYAFLAQVLSLADTTLEKRYLFCRLLALRLPKRSATALDLELDLTHLRVARTGAASIGLTGETTPLTSFTGDGTGSAYLPGMEPLSEVIRRFNETFGLDLTDADALHLQGIVADMAADPVLQQQAAANTRDNFGIPFGAAFEGAVVDRMKSAEDFTYKLLDDADLSRQVRAWVLPQVYEKARVGHQKTCPIGDLLERGEDSHLEYKSTLRWDLAKTEKSRAIEGAALKTVAAFLNSRYGGTLLIGVADAPSGGGGRVVGLDADYATLHKEGKDDADLFQLHLTQLVANAVGLAAAANVTTQIHPVDGSDICRVHMEPSGHPVYAEIPTVQGKRRSFFIRLNNGTRAIEDDLEIERYVAQRWGATQPATLATCRARPAPARDVT
jgi:type I restriction enzyme R subunit